MSATTAQGAASWDAGVVSCFGCGLFADCHKAQPERAFESWRSCFTHFQIQSQLARLWRRMAFAMHDLPCFARFRLPFKFWPERFKLA